MKHIVACFLGLVLLLFSCQDKNEKRIAENKKEMARKEIIFSTIEKAWIFYDEPINETAEETVKNWNELRLFLAELSKKPKKTIGAFQQKAKAISKAAMNLNTNIPLQFDKPQIKSRIAVVITKVRMLDLYINLDRIPSEKVVQLIGEINRELATLQREMDKTVEKSKIPLEEGEADLKRMLDSTRAIPNTIPNTETIIIE
ncbi:hypothetical protein SLW70_03350 [Flavobacterium sp. NG2]|uniref:hypothetical protein n=1 Tax=Flavobacterium sp. NG2 TaxID=3097547 RepID=UPI002A81EB1D|nr:hypothetical protein [Flavobacterium sp. NG2]WPR72190.1 hypothetical protein SLW70_03350 [Flavobacterium sp. NG2]